MIRIAWLALLLAPVAAHALSPRFEDSTAPDAATVKFVGTIPLVAIYENGRDCSGHRRWPKDRFKLDKATKAVDPNSTILRIAPDRPISFAIFRTRMGGKPPAGGISSETCALIFSFQPQPSRHYAIGFEMADECTVVLFETSTAESMELKPADGAELRLREPHGPLQDAEGSICKDDAG